MLRVPAEALRERADAWFPFGVHFIRGLVGTVRGIESVARQRESMVALGTLAAGFGQWGQQIALYWLVFLLTGSAAQLGAVAFAGGILSLLLAPFGGILSDRYPRRTIIVLATIGLSGAILVEASLSFLGLGTQPPDPSWGTMVNTGQRLIELSPWQAVCPGIAIAVTVLGINLVGDGLRDTLDPRLRT